MKDLYSILEIKSEASFDEIKQSFRHLAQKYHPDKNDNSLESQLLFRNIYEAYEILSDSTRKKAYDAQYQSKVKKRRPIPAQEEPVHRSIIDEFNYILWDIEDIINSNAYLRNSRIYNGKNLEDWVLSVLLFFDKWVLETAGYGDYFYESRKMERGELGRSKLFGNRDHRPYRDLKDYFYQIRMRTNSFLSKTILSDLEKEITTNNLKLIDAVFEAQKFAFHVITHVNSVLEGRSSSISTFIFSNEVFNPSTIEKLKSHSSY